MRIELRNLDWQRWLKRLALPALGAVAVLALLFGASWRAGSVLKRNQDWVADHGTRGNAIGAPDLFRELIERDVARFDLARFQIDLPPSDCADRLRIAKADPRCRGMSDDLLRLAQRLYQTAAGQAIRDEVARWNEAFDVIAVRDDRGRGQACSGQLDETATRLAAFILPKGCRPSQWSAFLGMTPLGGGDTGRIDISHRTAAEPAPHIFGFLAADRVPELGDWLAIDAQRLAGGTVELEARIGRQAVATKGAPRATAGRPLRIDIVGEVRAVTIDGTRYAAATIPSERDIRAGRASRAAAPQIAGAAILKEQLCLDAGRLRTPRCTPLLLRNGSPYATRLIIPSAAARTAETRIQIETAPVRSISGRLRQSLAGTFCGVRAPASEEGTTGVELPTVTPPPSQNPACAPRDGLAVGLRQRITDSLVFWCQGPADGENVRLGRESQCFIQYDTVERTSQPSEPNLTIRAGDGTVLAETVREADGQARVTVKPETIDLGLLPVVGIGDGDFLSLVGQLAARSRRGTPIDVRLTIDPALQRIVKEEVEQRLVRSAGQRTDVPAGRLFDGRRRAAIVIIDLDQPGDILAIATWPSLGRGERIADWDLRALESWNPPDSPLAALGWAQNNFLTVPGSSFKPITGLAAIQKAIDGDMAVRQAIIGYGSEAELQRGMQLSFAHEEYQPDPSNRLTIRNFQGGENRQRGTVRQAFIPPARTGCPSLGGGAQIGLCEALLKSNNVWFARLADMTDIVALNAVPQGRRSTEHQMAMIVRRLYPPTPFPLTDSTELRLSPGSRAHGTPVALNSIVARVRRLNPRITLAFNGIGQQVQTTPTSLATIYAGISTGRIVRPRIIAGPPQAQGEMILQRVTEAQQEDWLRYLRAGMKAVVSSPEGTGAGAFRNAGDLHPFLFAKTGTATVEDNADRRPGANTIGHTVWFAGYYDPRAAGVTAGRASPINRRFAFACMVTHARGGTGGSLCAPAIERVLRRMAGGTLPVPVPPRRQRTR